jgi:hypothetical protein
VVIIMLMVMIMPVIVLIAMSLQTDALLGVTMPSSLSASDFAADWTSG